MREWHDTPQSRGSRRQGMMKSDEVEAMLSLYGLGWELGGSPRSSGAAGTR